MVKKSLDSYPHINLKNLPPINPPPSSSASSDSKVKKCITITKYVAKVAKPEPEQEKEEEKIVKFDHQANTEADLLADQTQKLEINQENDEFCSIKHVDSKSREDRKILANESGDLEKRVSAKSQLNEICKAKKWKNPWYECCTEEGPGHLRKFIFKVVLEIEGAEFTILECYGDSRPTKKAAAEHAAEGALWYLKQLGYFPISKRKNTKKK